MGPEDRQAVAKELEKDGIKARVINIHTVKPIDEEIILKAAKETKGIFTIEDHSIIGGLGSSRDPARLIHKFLGAIEPSLREHVS